MEASFPFEVGHALLISIEGKNDHEEYFSKIEFIASNNITVSNPFNPREMPSVKEGDELNMYILQHNDVYNFKSRLESMQFGDTPSLVIEKPTDIIHYKRRVGIRYPLQVSVKFEIKANKIFSRNGIIIGTAFALNISEGGILLETTEKISIKSHEIKIHFTLPSYPEMHLDGKISRLKKEGKKTEFVVTFISLKPQQRENIMRYIFNTQKKSNMEKTLLEKL